MPRASGAREAIAAAVLLVASLALFWPGYATYDTIAQFGQVLAGEFDDWHPPAMARLWSGLHAVFGGSTAPMLVLQLGLYWIGLGLVAAVLARIARPRAAGAVLLIGALPPLVGWQGVVLKDSQMLGAMLAAIGLIAWWRLQRLRMPVWALAVVAILLAYATLVRANAAFATVPLAVVLASSPRSLMAKGLLALAAIAAMVIAMPAINHGLLAAEPSGVETTLPTYDLAGIAARGGGGPLAAVAGTLRARHCVSPIFWDPLGTPDRCELPAVTALRSAPSGQVYRLWLETALAHPLAYAEHRLAHLNATERWWVPRGWPQAAPPIADEPNDLGLHAPGAPARRWERLAGGLAETPLGWPIAYVVAALLALMIAGCRPASPNRTLVIALALSTIGLEASFAVISIASDLRYHLWPMTAALLAWALLADGTAIPRRMRAGGIVALTVVIGVGVVARLSLSPPPQTYRQLLAWG